MHKSKQKPPLPLVLTALSLFALTSCEDSNPPQQFTCIDKHNKIVLDLAVQTTKHEALNVGARFKDGRLIWSRGVKGCTFIDDKGNLLDCKHARVIDFSEGLAAVGDPYVDDKTREETERWGFIDKSGKLAIAANFQNVSSFSSGLAAALPFKEASNVSKWGFIDKAGKWAIKPQYEDVLPFSEGLAAVKVGSKWGYIRRDGSEAIKPTFLSVGSFHSGRAFACPLPDRHIIYIDQSGKQIYSTDYNELNRGVHEKGADYRLTALLELDLRNYAEGLLCARKDGLYGFKDTNGKWAIAPTYDLTFPFSDGLAVVAKNGRYGFIDKTGKPITECKYQTAIPFSDDVGAVCDSHGGYCYIDRQGKPLFQKYFRVAYPVSEGKAIVNFEGGLTPAAGDR